MADGSPIQPPTPYIKSPYISDYVSYLYPFLICQPSAFAKLQALWDAVCTRRQALLLGCTPEATNVVIP